MICALFGLSVLPLSWGGLFLVLLGVALLVIDLHVPTHGALTLSGLVAMGIGLATLFHKRQITRETAMQRSSNVNELRDLIDRGAGINNGKGSQSRASMPPNSYANGRVVARK